MKTSLVNVSVVAGVACVLTTLALAQEPASPPRLSVFQLDGQNVGRGRVGLETKVTRGAPYSAEATTEFVQLLPDGNRIVRRSVSRLYRDSEGRTRRELVSAVPEGSESPTIVITDPVEGINLILDPAARTVQRSPAMWAKVEGGSYAVSGRGGGTVVAGGRGRGNVTVVEGAQVDIKTAPGVDTTDAILQAEIELANKMADAAKALEAAVRGRGGVGTTSKEDLGQQTIEGVTATGTRSTTVIPAGAIGNEAPLTTVSEQWTSTDLGVLVLTKHSDPRAGETTYRLTNILRAEPDKSLFQAPSDYTVKGPGFRLRGGRQ